MLLVCLRRWRRVGHRRRICPRLAFDTKPTPTLGHDLPALAKRPRSRAALEGRDSVAPSGREAKLTHVGLQFCELGEHCECAGTGTGVEICGDGWADGDGDGDGAGSVRSANVW